MKLEHPKIPKKIIDLFLKDVREHISSLSDGVPNIGDETFTFEEFYIIPSELIPIKFKNNELFKKSEYYIYVSSGIHKHFSYYIESLDMFMTLDESGDSIPDVATHDILSEIVDDYTNPHQLLTYPNINSVEYIKIVNNKTNKIFKKLNEENVPKVAKIVEEYKRFMSNYYDNLTNNQEIGYLESYLIFKPTSDVEYLILILEYDADDVNETPYRNYAQIVDGKATTKFDEDTLELIENDDNLVGGFERIEYLKHYSYDDWKKDINKVNNIFKKLHESNEVDIKTHFFQFLSENEFGSITAEDILPNYNDDSNYNWSCKLVKINDKYYLVSEETDHYEENRDYYIYLGDGFYKLSETDKFDLVEIHGIGLVENVTILEDIEFSEWYNIKKNKFNDIYKKLNEGNTELLDKFKEFVDEHFDNDISADEDDMFDRYNRLGYMWTCQLLDVRHINDLKHMDYIAVSESGLPRDMEKEYYVYDAWNDRFEYYEDNEYIEKTLYLADPIELAYYDYKQWILARKKSVDIFKKLNENKEETLIDWLNTRFGDKIGYKIGFGNEGIIYEYGEDKVIKLMDNNINHYKPFLNKDIPGIIKIYDLGEMKDIPKEYKILNNISINVVKDKKLKSFKDFSSYKDAKKDMIYGTNTIGYIVMEKLNIFSAKPIMENISKNISDNILNNQGVIESLVKQLNLAYENTYRLNDPLLLLYEMIMHDKGSTIKLLKELDIYDKYTIQLVTCLDSVSDYFPKWNDIHIEQFGLDKTGDLKVFDFSN